MGILFLALLVVIALAVGIFGGSAVLYLTAKLFKVPNVSFRTSIKILLLAGFSSFAAATAAGTFLVLAGLNTAIVQLLEIVIGFFVFYFFLKKYWQVSWSKALGIYILSTIAWLILTFGVVIPIRLFVMQPFLVSGEAMAPTYPSGEYLLINEFSKSFGRGDVIVFRYPKDPSQYFIKRIIGLPGETVAVANGQVSINGQVLSEPYISGSTPGNSSITLGADEYYVMGDNRQASNDSREFGQIKKSSILGKILVDVAHF